MFRIFFDRSKRQVSDIIRGSFESGRYNQEKFMTEDVSRKKTPVNNGTTIRDSYSLIILNTYLDIRSLFACSCRVSEVVVETLGSCGMPSSASRSSILLFSSLRCWISAFFFSRSAVGIPESENVLQIC